MNEWVKEKLEPLDCDKIRKAYLCCMTHWATAFMFKGSHQVSFLISDKKRGCHKMALKNIFRSVKGNPVKSHDFKNLLFFILQLELCIL